MGLHLTYEELKHTLYNLDKVLHTGLHLTYEELKLSSILKFSFIKTGLHLTYEELKRESQECLKSLMVPGLHLPIRN